MAYNYGYPVSYQPMVPYASYQQQAPQMGAAMQQPIYQQPMQQTTMNQTQQNTQSGSSDITWVQGIEGAKAYPVAAGTSVMLMDADPNALSFYIKSTDASGMPLPIRIFDYKERIQNPTPNQNASQINQQSQAQQTISTFDESKFVTWESLESELTKVKDALENKLSEYLAKKPEDNGNNRKGRS